MRSQQFSVFIFLIRVLKSLPIAPKAPRIIGITTNFLDWQSLPMSLFNSCYRSTFYCSSSFTLVSNGLASSIMWHSSFCFLTIKNSGLLYSSLRLVCTANFHSIFALSFSNTFSGVCVYTIWLHLKIQIFSALPNEQLHQLYHIAICGTAFVQAFYILQSHDCFLSFPHNLHRGETLCQLCPLCCLFSVLGLMQPLAFRLFLFSTILSLASSRFSGSSLHFPLLTSTLHSFSSGFLSWSFHFLEFLYLLPLVVFHCCFPHTYLGFLFPFPHNRQH